MKDWKTTVAGLVIAVIQVIVPLIKAGRVSWSTVGMAAGTAALGYFAADKKSSQ